MNKKQKIGLIILMAIAIATTYWSGYVNGSGHTTFLNAVFSVYFIWTLTLLPFAWIVKRKSVPPSSGGSHRPPGPNVPVQKPPGGPPEIYCEHAAR
ncbi:MAG TPA: hypothetical protein VH280_17240 [Verrucomicrobiae bacterium]|jgi:hypothetical protein|nr:hypothetical protein [Verrucomicrobiae bacterium]